MGEGGEGGGGADLHPVDTVNSICAANSFTAFFFRFVGGMWVKTF